MPPIERLVRGRHDGLGGLFGQRTQFGVDARRGALHEQHGANEFARHFLAGDTEILERALRLSAPQSVRGDFDGTEGVALDAVA